MQIVAVPNGANAAHVHHFAASHADVDAFSVWSAVVLHKESGSIMWLN